MLYPAPQGVAANSPPRDLKLDEPVSVVNKMEALFNELRQLQTLEEVSTLEGLLEFFSRYSFSHPSIIANSYLILILRNRCSHAFH